MTTQETSPGWVVIKKTGGYWAGGDDWAPDTAAAYVYTSKQAAKDTYRDVHSSFPRTLDVVALTPEQCQHLDTIAAAEQVDDDLPEYLVDSSNVTAGVMPEDAVGRLIDATIPGGVTDQTPGQTDRVNAALAKATAKAETPDTTGPEATPGTDVAVDDAIDAELVSTAAELDIEIRSTADRYTSLVISADNTWTELAELIEEAQHRNIHTDLGFASWPKYIADVVKTNLPHIGKDTEARQSLVGVLTGAGLSGRAQAEIVGVSNATISRDQEVLHDVTPDATPIATVTSINGGTFTKPAPKPKPDPKPEPVAAQTQSATPKVDKLTAEVDAVIAEAQALAAKVDAISDALDDRKLKVADGTLYSLDKRIKAVEGIVGEAFETLGAAVDNAC
jgi:hypothetical protein